MKKLIYILLFVLSFTACREKMDLVFDDSNNVPVLAVEGYVTQGEPTSKVTLRLTSPYFTNQPSPVPNTVAYVLFRKTDTLGVVMIDTLKELVAGSGDYYSKGNYIPSVGDQYQLEISYKGEIFKADSKIHRPAVIDSVGYEFQPKKLTSPKGYSIKMAARDLPGVGEYYYFEKYKNGEKYWESLQDKFNIWEDGITDGLTFPRPVLFGINPQANEDKPGYDQNKDFPYTIGDSITVKIFSIDKATFNFYNDIVLQASSTEGGPLGPLFAPPSDNVRTNLYNTKPDGLKVVGIFSARGYVPFSVKIK